MLDEFAQSIADLKGAAGWTATDYYNNLSGNGEYSLVLEHRAAYASKDSPQPRRPADTVVRDGSIVITIYGHGINQGDSGFRKFTYVHEQAHVWDIASKGSYTKELARATGGCQCRDSGTGVNSYSTTDKPPTNYAKRSSAEDWAETVATAVYPNSSERDEYIMGNKHGAIARKYLPNAMYFNMP